jgi:hypothetical protein
VHRPRVRRTTVWAFSVGVLMLSFERADARVKTSRPPSVLIPDVPHVQQKPDFCGEACAEMYLRKLGRPFTQDDVFLAAGVDPALGRGAHTPELARALRSIGFDVGPVWHEVRPRLAAVEAVWRGLYADLARGIPSIICMHYDERAGSSEHFRLVLGYDRSKDQVVYHEPARANGAYRRMARSRFLKLWPLKYSARRWTVIRLRLDPARLLSAPPARPPGFTDADYAQHVLSLKSRLPGRGFTIVIQKPFVVVGDEAPEVVRQRAVHTVKWAVDRLKESFFDKDPLQILTVWLFQDRESYERNALRLFGEKPGTPFGYYSSRHRALVMNIATGGGTLVHEIVHPFMEANFPGVPAWFNEGLGSLYEQCTERHGRIWGLTNWRLAGLQNEIRAGRLPSFRQLLSMSSDAFYSDRRGDHYAQARYLLYYLQEKGLLVEFFRRFRAQKERDPTGYATLQAVLGEKDMDAFQKRWEAYVLGLEFP